MDTISSKVLASVSRQRFGSDDDKDDEFQDAFDKFWSVSEVIEFFERILDNYGDIPVAIGKEDSLYLDNTVDIVTVRGFYSEEADKSKVVKAPYSKRDKGMSVKEVAIISPIAIDSIKLKHSVGGNRY
jgi:hypothetical protein